MRACDNCSGDGGGEPLPRYQLYISFRSNERPFSTTHDPYPVDRFGADDEAARQWCEGMKEGLQGYDVTLLKDGQPLADHLASRTERGRG